MGDHRISARLAALAEAIQRRQMEQALPVDGLSCSLMQYEEWLVNLDERGKADLLAEMNEDGMDLTMEDVERMIEGVRG